MKISKSILPFLWKQTLKNACHIKVSKLRLIFKIKVFIRSNWVCTWFGPIWSKRKTNRPEKRQKRHKLLEHGLLKSQRCHHIIHHIMNYILKTLLTASDFSLRNLLSFLIFISFLFFRSWIHFNCDTNKGFAKIWWEADHWHPGAFWRFPKTQLWSNST